MSRTGQPGRRRQLRPSPGRLSVAPLLQPISLTPALEFPSQGPDFLHTFIRRPGSRLLIPSGPLPCCRDTGGDSGGQIRPAAPAGARKTRTRPTVRFARQPKRRQPTRRSGRDPGSRPYAPITSRSGKPGRKHFPHSPCRLGRAVAGSARRRSVRLYPALEGTCDERWRRDIMREPARSRDRVRRCTRRRSGPDPRLDEGGSSCRRSGRRQARGGSTLRAAASTGSGT